MEKKREHSNWQDKDENYLLSFKKNKSFHERINQRFLSFVIFPQMYCTSKIGKVFTVLKMCLQIASKKQRYQQNDILQNIYLV